MEYLPEQLSGITLITATGSKNYYSIVIAMRAFANIDSDNCALIYGEKSLYRINGKVSDYDEALLEACGDFKLVASPTHLVISKDADRITLTLKDGYFLVSGDGKFKILREKIPAFVEPLFVQTVLNSEMVYSHSKITKTLLNREYRPHAATPVHAFNRDIRTEGSLHAREMLLSLPSMTGFVIDKGEVFYNFDGTLLNDNCIYDELSKIKTKLNICFSRDFTTGPMSRFPGAGQVHEFYRPMFLYHLAMNYS